MTQDNPISPMIFNIVLDEFVKMLLEVVCSPQEAQHSMGLLRGYGMGLNLALLLKNYW